MRLIATKKEQQNHSVIDPWTVVHFAAGLAAGLVRFPRDWALTSAVAYELAEQYAERKSWGQELLETSRPESVPNAITDVVVFMVGHRLGQAWNDTAGK
jgi:hypothetical protein